MAFFMASVSEVRNAQATFAQKPEKPAVKKKKNKDIELILDQTKLLRVQLLLSQ